MESEGVYGRAPPGPLHLELRGPPGPLNIESKKREVGPPGPLNAEYRGPPGPLNVEKRQFGPQEPLNVQFDAERIGKESKQMSGIYLMKQKIDNLN